MPRRFDVVISADADGDLASIHDYLTVHASPAVAAAPVERMIEAAAVLETFPLRGPVPPELEGLSHRGYRQLSLRPYRLIYKVVDQAVVIVLIADGRRGLPALLQRRLLSR